MKGPLKVIYQIIAVCVISGIAGIKKPIYGGLAGLILSPLIHVVFYKFDLFLFLIFMSIGFVIGICLGSILNWFFGGRDDLNRKPYYTSMHITGGGMGSGIVYTDEEEKNAKQNENKNG